MTNALLKHHENLTNEKFSKNTWVLYQWIIQLYKIYFFIKSYL